MHYLSAALICLSAMGAQGRSSPLKVIERDFHTRWELLIARPMPRDTAAAARAGDSTFLPNPRPDMVSNIECWGNERDGDPICSTFVQLDSARLVFRERPVRTVVDRDAFAKRIEADLIQAMRRDLPRITGIELRRYEETDRGWVFLPGLMLLFGTFAAGALAELAASQAMDRGYRINYAAIPAVAVGLGATAYLGITMDTRPTLRITRIRIDP